MKVVKLLDQASEDGPRGSLGEQVGEHHDAGEVFDRDNATVDEIAKELGGAQDVLGLLEGNRIEGHADGGFAVSHSVARVGVENGSAQPWRHGGVMSRPYSLRLRSSQLSTFSVCLRQASRR